MKVDWALAVLLTVGAQLAIWLGSDAAHHRLGAALVAPAITAPIAVRRRYPALVGTAVPLVAAVDHDLWDPQFVGYPVATICALYSHPHRSVYAHSASCRRAGGTQFGESQCWMFSRYEYHGNRWSCRHRSWTSASS